MLGFVACGTDAFFCNHDVERVQVELVRAHRTIGYRRSGGPLTINDISGIATQDWDVLPRRRSLFPQPTRRSRRLAVASALTRMQRRRATRDRHARVFTNTIDGEKWLLGENANVVA